MEKWFVALTEGSTKVIIPLLLIAVIYIADTVTRRAAGEQYRLSVRAGWWAGFIAFVLFAKILAQSPYDIPGGANVAPYTVLPAALVAGFYMVYILKAIIPTRYGGFAVMIMVFLGASTLVSFLAADANNAGLVAIITFATLGLAFGILMHAVVNPKSITGFYPHPDQNPFRMFMPHDGGDQTGQDAPSKPPEVKGAGGGSEDAPVGPAQSGEAGTETKDKAPEPPPESEEAQPKDEPPAA